MTTPTPGVKARVSSAGMYYDVGDRLIASVNVGTNDGSAWTRPTGVPSRSDTVLVTSFDYDSVGRQWKVIDPKGIESRTYFDDAGRTLKTIEHNVDGVVGDDNDKTTEYAYNAAGMTTLTARLTGGAVQTTEWVYGITRTGGNGIDSNDTVRATRWPDPTTGSASSGIIRGQVQISISFFGLPQGRMAVWVFQ